MALIKPRIHQSDLMNFHSSSKMLGTLAWHGMGLGKTLSTLWLAREHMARLRQQGVKAPKFLVIVPKSAIPTWKVECHNNTPDILGSMVIYPYSQLHHAIKSIKYMDIRMLVFDESHYLKSPATNRIEALSKFLVELGKISGKFQNGRVILLTGTPMPNSAAELYTSWAICTSPNLQEAADRLMDSTRFENWKKSFSKKKEIAWSKGRGARKKSMKANKWEGVANESMLQKLLAPFVHYRRVEDCIDLPDKQEIAIDLGLPDDRLLADADIEAPEAYMALLERLARAKTPYMMDWVRDYLDAGNQQLLVFANYRFPLEELKEKYPNDVRMITGSETGAERALNLKEFKEGKFRVLAMTFKCGSESLNLQNAFVSLYHGYPWTDGAVKQAMARTHRSGQEKKTLHYFLTSGHNDQRILSLVRSKEEATTKVEDMLLETVKLTLDTLI
jgi:SNF2 family DNA or RNA helicase